MKYITVIAIVLTISFLAVSMFAITINKKNTFKENMKYTSIALLITLPILILVAGCLFLAFKLVVNLVPIQITNFEIFLISVLGVYVIFICDFLSKKILVSIGSRLLAKKYKNKDLDNNQMMEIANANQKVYRMLTMVSMFLFSMIIYSIIMKIAQIDKTNTFIVIISAINLTAYVIFFRTNYGAIKN